MAMGAGGVAALATGGLGGETTPCGAVGATVGAGEGGIARAGLLDTPPAAGTGAMGVPTCADKGGGAVVPGAGDIAGAVACEGSGTPGGNAPMLGGTGAWATGAGAGDGGGEAIGPCRGMNSPGFVSCRYR